MKKPAHLLVAVIMLFLIGLNVTTKACEPPDCPPCQHWNGSVCVNSCDPAYCCGDPRGCQDCCWSYQCDDCQTCSNFECVLKSGSECDEDSDCADCYVCDTSVGGTCACECGVLVTGVTADAETACVGCEVVFTVTTDPSNECDCVDWEAGGNPSNESTDGCTHSVTWDNPSIECTVSATSSCNSESSDSDDVTIVSIDKIQYLDQQYVDITGTIYVVIGDTVQFMAIPNPYSASWPSGKPIWSGTAGASGTGATKSVTFNALSSSTTDYKTIVVEGGNSSVTVNVIVYDFDGVFTPADPFDGRNPNKYGLEEEVALTSNIIPDGVSVSQLGGLEWTKDGVGSISNAGDDGTADYDAEHVEGDALFYLTIKSGTSKNVYKSYDKSVIAPYNISFVRKPNTGIWHREGYSTVGFMGEFYLRPTDVSFSNIEYGEGSCDSTTDSDGWYSKKLPNGISHLQNGPYSVGGGNITDGCKVFFDDYVWDGYSSPPDYEDGWITWEIPQRYLVNGDWYTIISLTDRSDIDSTGKKTIKKGTVEISRELNDHDSDI